MPEIDGIPILNSTKRALEFAQNYSNIAFRANSTDLEKLLEEAEIFSGNEIFQKLFPQFTNLMRVNFWN